MTNIIWSQDEVDKAVAMLGQKRGDGSSRYTRQEVADYMGMPIEKVRSLSLRVQKTVYARDGGGGKTHQPIPEDFDEVFRWNGNNRQATRALAARINALRGRENINV